MVARQSQSGSRFTVDLGSIKLPAVLEKQVETDIRAVVLRALANVDFGGTSRLSSSIFDRFPGRTLGLWLDPDAAPPEVGGPLLPQDHTIILREIMNHPVPILKYLKFKPGGPKPTGPEVLEAALQVEQIDPYTKERIRAVLEILPKLEDAMAKAPKTANRDLANLQRLLVGQPIQEQVRILRDLDVRSSLVTDGMGEAMEAAAQLLMDGASSIYSPDSGFNRALAEGQPQAVAKDAVDTVKDADTIGATGGGLAGTLLPGVGTAAGAAAGGAGASAGAAIAEFVLWLWD